ncbi:60S acidic ribosomal protein P2-1-like [Pyrus ussuriensis x Pyrus communis]|uniref:60S acidic ribosomal protein P2-1-like n=1 Tax=Pyrus ussuriensis x Pyrus communis TaxID=2448454 RepID=A0A5N5H6F5_9ROSA|nr:60S acidic ribosomal protein P2-1-like [Pyrus ussuriensis x Pyrus communis]
MKVVAVYLLAVLGRKTVPSAEHRKDILGSLLLSEVEGKDMRELIASGREKMASVPSGGGGSVAVAATGGGGSGATAPAAAEAKKEERVEEEESDEDMDFGVGFYRSVFGGLKIIPLCGKVYQQNIYKLTQP